MRYAALGAILCFAFATGTPASELPACNYCSCKDGPGFRLPNGKCASWAQDKRFCAGACYPTGTKDERIDAARVKEMRARMTAAPGSNPAIAAIGLPPKATDTPKPSIGLGLISPAEAAPLPMIEKPTYTPLAAEAVVQATCPNDTIVWLNPTSHIYHFRGTASFGTTKKGAFLCETAAKTEGDRAAANEVRP